MSGVDPVNTVRTWRLCAEVMPRVRNNIGMTDREEGE